MKYTATQEKILKIVSTNIFLDKETAALIKSKMDSLSQSQLEAILVLLQEAEEKQNTALMQVIATQPDFLTKLSSFKEMDKFEQQLKKI